MNYLRCLFLLLASLQMNAQDFSVDWEGYFAFTEIVDVEQSQDNIYAATGNAVFVYSPAIEAIRTITTINGLSGDRISQLHYSAAQDILVVGYDNGLLQLVEADGNVATVVAIRDKQVIRPDRKRINEFLEFNGLLYIATDFGIALYNLDRQEFDDTYFIGAGGEQLRVSSLEVYRGFLYAATTEAAGGMRRANIADPFLLDFMNWSQTNTDVWSEVFEYRNELLATTVDRFLNRFNGSTFTGSGLRLPRPVLDVDTTDGLVAFASRQNIAIYDRNLNPVFTIDQVDGENPNFTSVVLRDRVLYAGTEERGLLRLDLDNQTDFEYIVRDGPTRNRAFSITSAGTDIWVGYGDYDGGYNPFANGLDSFGISRLRQDEGWTNFSFDEVLQARSLSSITINPDNPEQLYLNSMQDGVVLFEEEMAVELFTFANSSLDDTFVPTGGGQPFRFLRMTSGVFDGSGNFWVYQSRTETPLHRRSPDGQWSGISIENDFPGILTSTEQATQLEVDSAGNLYFGTLNDGLFGYNPTEGLFGQIIDEPLQGNLANNYVSALEIDQNNTLWIGSTEGLRVYAGASRLFSENPGDARSIVVEDIGGIPREILSGQAVIDIETDGNNNKWVATASSGAFLFSPSGQETIFQFTRENSPLPSNTVNDITIEESTGRVFFATDNGIVSFQGARASKPRENLSELFAYPNPVRPGYDGNVTIDGLTDRARIKITDIEGNLVFELVSNGGSVTWDQRNFGGTRVRSGVYLLLVNTDDVIETAVFKLMVIR